MKGLLLLVVVSCAAQCSTLECYDTARAILVTDEAASRLGDSLATSHKESQVNEILNDMRMPLKGQFERNFRDMHSWIDSLELFQLFRKMPKGALLHTHGIADAQLSVRVGTYLPSCFVDLRRDSPTYRNFGYANSNATKFQGWTNTVEARADAEDKVVFDQMLYNFTQYFTPSLSSTNETALWNVDFNAAIVRAGTLLSDASVHQAVQMQGFQNLVDDGIYHYELRALGFSADDYMNLLNLLAKFNSNRTETEKLTIRFIVCDIRNVSVESSFATMKNMIDLRAANSTLRTMLVGYDVVGEEDLLNRLEFYVPAILKARTYAASLNQSVDMFPHCGETANVTHAGSNLFDGVLLSSKRLGHAIGLRDHPLLQTIVNDTQIGLELCPISNQLLRYVSDFRLHPGASYVASGLPVTLSTDDSTIYGLKSAAPSYEFFLAFATWDLTLSSVKAIAQNSIIYSALDSASKTAKLSAFDVKWNEWLDMVLNASFVSRL